MILINDSKRRRQEKAELTSNRNSKFGETSGKVNERSVRGAAAIGSKKEERRACAYIHRHTQRERCMAVSKIRQGSRLKERGINGDRETGQERTEAREIRSTSDDK